MLAVFSEVNVLSSLNKIGVFPDIYATDIEMFRNVAIGLKEDANIVIIIGTGCDVNRFKTLELVESLFSRKKAGYIGNVYVLSNLRLPRVPVYYLYDLQLNKTKRSGDTVKNDGELYDVFYGLSDNTENGQVYLNKFDLGDSTDARKRYEEETSKVDDYVKLIRKPQRKGDKKVSA